MNIKKFRFVIFVLAFAILTVLLFSLGINAEEQSVLRLAHDQTSGHPYDLGAKRFGEAVEARTNGAVTIKIYPASQLGDTAEQIEGLKMGTLDLSIAAFSHVSQFVPELGIFGAPYLFESDKQFDNVFDGEVGQILDNISLKRYNIRLLTTYTSGNRVLFNSKRSVFTPNDLEGLKIRVMTGPADALTWKTFGAIATPMAYSELYSAMQAGVVDGGENECVSVLRNKFYEPCPYIATTYHLVLPMGVFISNKTFQELPEEYRKIVLEEAQKSAIWERDYITRMNNEALDEMISKYGVKANLVDKVAFMEKGKPVQEIVAKNLGVMDLLEKIRAAKK